MQPIIRPELTALRDFGVSLSASRLDDEKLAKAEMLLNSLDEQEVLNADELAILVSLFGEDDCYGLAWTMIHIIEKSPMWLPSEFPLITGNRWHNLLLERASR